MLMLLALVSFGLLTAASYKRYANATRALPPAAGESLYRDDRLLPGHHGVDIANLRFGDVVVLDDHMDDWLITGTHLYREEDETWVRHVITDGAEDAWLDVYGAPKRRVAFSRAADDFPQHGALGLNTSFRGDHYTLVTRGDARVREMLLNASQNIDFTELGVRQYIRYRNVPNNMLYIEESENLRKAWIGKELREDMISIMPGRPPDALG